VFFKRLNGKGCLAALLTGFLLGVLRLAVDTPVTLKMAGFEQGYSAGSLLWILNNIYFQYYSLFIFAASTVVLFAVSHLTERPSLERLSGLTYATVTEAQSRQSRRSWGRCDVVSSGVVLLLILAAYLYFNG
jgi:SSS family solute:Na+ symporter